MRWKAALFAPLAVSLSMTVAAEPTGEHRAPHDDPALSSLTPEAADASDLLGRPGQAERWLALDAFYPAPEARQVRIEQRVIIRISPRSAYQRQSLVADLPDRPAANQYVERKMDDCIDVAKIAGVQATRDNRLLLYLRDRRLVGASLEKQCNARDYYSGFYIEPNDDGRICINRDKLLSRSGANCEIDRMRQLVAVSGD